MADFDNINGLLARIKKQVRDSLKSDVAPVVKDKYKENIQSDIYDSYNPVEYHRRNSLLDESNMEDQLLDETTLEVKNVALPSQSVMGSAYVPAGRTTFIGWIENGSVPNIFNNRTGYPWTGPRPATAHTIERLNSEKQHVQALKQGLRVKGFNIE